MARLILDYRESALSAALTSASVSHACSRLDVGDVVILADGQIKLVAERKTTQDLAASNVDGRYRDQRARLASFPDATLVYIIEGRDWDAQPILRRLATRLMLRYGFPLLQTSCVEETATWLGVMLEQLGADPQVFTRTAPDISHCGVNAARCMNITPSGVAVAMLSAVPGLGKKRASELLRARSVADLAAASVESLSAMRVGGRRLGDAPARALHEALRSVC